VIPVRIAGIGAYLPVREIANAGLTEFPPESLPLIEAKTGIRARRRAADTESTSDLAAQAVRQCLDRAGIAPTAVDALVVATSSPDRIQPATAARTQALVGTTNAYAFDINSVCAGSVYGLHVGRALIAAGARCVVVAAAEVYSRFLNPQDFSTYPYFGDGAGAAVLTPDVGEYTILDAVLHTDGTGADVIQIPAGGTMQPAHTVKRPADLFFRMVGRKVYEFAVDKGTEVVLEVLARAGLTVDQIAVLIPHQANVNILREIATRLGLPFDRVAVNLDRVGNTAAASVLIALEEVDREGKCPAGGFIALSAFGGGLSWAGMLLQRRK
jgi:3-oxoacyl-[acyl-carrier-protein] synthase-3